MPADEIAKEEYPDDPEGASYKAARKAELLRFRALEERRSFCFETVFSHLSKVDFLGQAKGLGYQVILVYIHLANTELNVARVDQRKKEGGHGVPEDKILTRIPRTMTNVQMAVALCDQVYFLDNSSVTDPFKQIATVINWSVQHKVDSVPDWAKALLHKSG